MKRETFIADAFSVIAMFFALGGVATFFVGALEMSIFRHSSILRDSATFGLWIGLALSVVGIVLFALSFVLRNKLVKTNHIVLIIAEGVMALAFFVLTIVIASMASRIDATFFMQQFITFAVMTLAHVYRTFFEKVGVDESVE